MANGQWYQDAVIYQLHVRSFFDSKGDGVGDFVGLTSKLDYVASLGVTAIWLLPFYPSPLRDEGYDIADYTTVNPAYGTLDDFRSFLQAAHQRGLKVITELVINHTSDQHAWFQRARTAPIGSPERNYYVWSDTEDRYSGVRVIFRDFETSNWSWDPVARQYYWHRFYSHQPDLNFDNAEVRAEVLRVLDFWFDLGVDGLRLDAVPYLFERDGTNCESLPETHAYLRELREHIDQHYPDRMLLAEANQWPDETAAYFGNGDECHMCFHFPLMPRLFLSLQQENRFPIIDILRQTPTPPEKAQWAVFLRNHDELTLEMVSEEDRLFMWTSYATDPQARINMGVRRRLAPLLRNDRRKIELLHGLLFALGGTPVLYYGDEIMMGDNFYLRDRDAVRTPMQWSPDRNAGFSTANPQRLFLPPIIDPEFHFQTNNVETHEASPHSFLWWLRRVIRLRGQYAAFGRGSLTFLTPANPRILTFLRQTDDEVLLVVCNLSRQSQFVELDLGAFRGRVPRELFGQADFPMIGELPYLLTLGPHGFYWFALRWPTGAIERTELAALPELTLNERWEELLEPNGLRQLEAALPEFLVQQVWFPGGRQRIRHCRIAASLPLPLVTNGSPNEREGLVTFIVSAELNDGLHESYQLPLVIADTKRAECIINDRPNAGVAKITFSNPLSFGLVICDATAENEFWQACLAPVSPTAMSSAPSRLNWEALSAEWNPNDITPLCHLARSPIADAACAIIKGQTFVSLFRRVDEGTHPEEELGLALKESAFAAHLPQALAALRLKPSSRLRPTTTMGLIHSYAPFEETVAEHVGAIWSRLKDEASCAPVSPLASDSAEEPSQLNNDAEATLAVFLSRCALLGHRVGELHRALAGLHRPQDLKPETVTVHYRRSIYEAKRAALALAIEQGRQSFKTSDGPDRDLWQAFFDRELELQRRLAGVLHIPLTLNRIRSHGALTLDSLLWTGTDVVVLRTGGERHRPLAERRLKRLVFRDLSRLLLSLREVICGIEHPTDSASLDVSSQSLVCGCLQRADAAVLTAYRQAVGNEALIPDDEVLFNSLLEAFRVSTAISQLLIAQQSNDQQNVRRLLRIVAMS